MTRPLTKPGKYGPLYCYRVTYRDVSGSPEFKQSLWAYSPEHMREKFYGAIDADGWEIVSWQCAPERGIFGTRPVYKEA